ncbi:unnamed protein product [Lactuca virosa]|uniref:SWIM-type domain-containing protein n=1 Tax=Lactuca virosa TaxID=75947 RepID=A0AAU9LII7_9ASTR|nr:unnamed protein product [Lactuca virosa]
MRNPRRKIRRAQPSDEMEKGPYYDSDFEESELESESESESERAFVVDEELGDYDANEHTTFPFDAFLYDLCNVPVYNKRENVDDEVIREEGHSDKEIEDDEDEVDQKPTKYSVHDPSVHWKKMKPHLGENWELFIKLLVEDLGLELGEGLTIISDQHKGLVEAVKEKLPLVEHRQCARHVMSTIHLTWRGDVCPTILTKLDDWCKDMRLWSVVASETNVFEVRLGFESFQVDLGEQLCTCRLWEISGIPCVHACATMNHTQQQPETLTSSWFSKEKFVETYKGNIRPLNGSKMWARTPYAKPLPSPARRMPGRPKTRRRKHVTEKNGEYRKIKSVGGTKICQNCWEEWHNKRTCKNPTKPQTPKEKKRKGRPVTRDVAMKKTTASTSQKSQNSQHTQEMDGQMDGQARCNSQKRVKQRHLNLLKGYMKLLASGYSEDEVYHVLYEQDLDVEVLAEVPPVLETVHEEVPEVEEDPEVEQVPHVAQVDIVPETEDEGIAETPPSQRLMRTRRPSERITKIQTGMKAVGKKVAGPGRSRLDPVSLE